MDDVLIEKLKKIKMLVTDIDGVLSDGSIYYGEDGNELKQFNVKDGYGAVALRKSGIILGAITGRSSKIVEKRLDELGFHFLHQGVKEKLPKLEKELIRFGCDLDEVLYLGDDIPDLAIMSEVGIAVCPNDAVDAVKSSVHYISKYGGGRGVLREVADYLLAFSSHEKEN
ncbi:MAG: HAD hydrolase family protein [Cyclobacteriaceae bacterium]|nr:HAD hydrolase family protein [Cyclobacteriaceae bacterium]MCH8515121.1 HAD hydrolase family protein [Cyclobacteriaceae bacterium]